MKNLKIVSYLGLKSRGIKKANPDLLSAHNPPSFDILLNGKYLLWKKYLLWAVVMAELEKVGFRTRKLRFKSSHWKFLYRIS